MKKLSKKLVAVLMTLLMMISLVVPAFATNITQINLGGYTITYNSPFDTGFSDSFRNNLLGALSGNTQSGYVDVGNAYSLLNKFRTTKGVWYWNSDNKTKTVFNTKKSNTLCKLKKNAQLEETAKIRAKECSIRYSHYRPNGTRCFTAFPSGMTAMGENIAYGFTTAAEVETAWEEADMNYDGQGHRRNMLESEFNAVGIACYYKNGVYYWAQAFGKV